MGYPRIKFDKRYWIFIAAAILAHFVAIVCTYYAVTILGIHECNPFMGTAFSQLGFLITSSLSILLIIGFMMFVPFTFGQTEKLGIKSAAFMGLFVGALTIDAINDILVLSGNPLSKITGGFLLAPYQLLNIQLGCLI
jgi:hypothetical protein